jgi:hypothetical protein
MEVEDLLVQAVGVERGIEEDEGDRSRGEREGEAGERRQTVIP